jgi:beta-galactosidase
MSNQEDFKGKQKKAFQGMCLALVRSTTTAGQVRVTATAPGLPPVTLSFLTKT